MLVRRRPVVRVAGLLVLLVAGASGAAGAAGADDAVSGRPETVRGLGTTSFVTSTKSAEAQTDFMRGLLLLHLFEYPDAAKAFQAAEKVDPGFAMAYWGEAMTANHGVWSQVDAAAGKAVLERFGPTAEARAARVSDPRERAYLAAVELLYTGAGSKADRDRMYAKAMQRLSSAYPADRNAQLFYALALLSQSEGVRDVPVYLEADGDREGGFSDGAEQPWCGALLDPRDGRPGPCGRSVGGGARSLKDCTGCGACAAYVFAHLPGAGDVGCGGAGECRGDARG